MAKDDLFPGLDLKALVPKIPEYLAPPQLKQLKNPMVEAVEENYASAFYERLLEVIKRFDADLDQNHEVGVRLVSFGEAVVFHLVNIGFWNPSLIFFRGNTEDGTPVELIQHVSQISILLMRMPRKDTSKPKRPIGFTACQREKENGHEEGLR